MKMSIQIRHIFHDENASIQFGMHHEFIELNIRISISKMRMIRYASLTYSIYSFVSSTSRKCEVDRMTIITMDVSHYNGCWCVYRLSVAAYLRLLCMHSIRMFALFFCSSKGNSTFPSGGIVYLT